VYTVYSDGLSYHALTINAGLLSTDICTCIWYNHVLDLTCVLQPSIAYGKEINSVVFTIILPYAKTYTNAITR